MIRKLRMRFIGLSMCSLLVVLGLIVGSINILNYRKIIRDADTVLSLLADNSGVFPRRNEAFPKSMSPELPYESRFFTVVLDHEGLPVAVDTGRIAAVDTDTAISYAQKLFAQDASRGFSGHYRYIRQPLGTGVRMIFLDCGRNLSTFRSFLVTSLVISLSGLLAVFLLIILLSARIVRPVLESYEKQKQFITDAGHEMKTPLTIIDADAEVMQSDVGENEWLEDIRTQTRRLAALTNDLIFLSKMEETDRRLRMIEFPFSDVVAEEAQSFQAPAKTKGIFFSCRIQPMLSLCGDEKALRQLVSILLDNALKYAGEGGGISVSLQRQGRAVNLTVYNTTSEPVSRENLDRIFERFYRMDQSRNSQTGGHGIGLSIAKAIVTAHRGKISAASVDGQSLTISVSLPV